MSIQILLERIEEKRRQLLLVEQRRVQLEAELAAYEDALALLSPPRPLAERSPRRMRNAGIGWREVMAGLVVSHPARFNVEQIARALRSEGVERTAGQIRSRMGDYRRDGLIESAGRGWYRPTASGQVLFRREGAATSPQRPDAPMAAQTA